MCYSVGSYFVVKALKLLTNLEETKFLELKNFQKNWEFLWLYSGVPTHCHQQMAMASNWKWRRTVSFPQRSFGQYYTEAILAILYTTYVQHIW